MQAMHEHREPFTPPQTSGLTRPAVGVMIDTPRIDAQNKLAGSSISDLHDGLNYLWPVRRTTWRFIHDDKRTKNDQLPDICGIVSPWSTLLTR